MIIMIMIVIATTIRSHLCGVGRVGGGGFGLVNFRASLTSVTDEENRAVLS